MKYYAELSKIEDEIIRLDTVKSLLRVVADNTHSVEPQDIQHSLWHICDEVIDINEKISLKFDHLWSDIRDDSCTEENKTSYKTPTQTSTEVNDIVNSWVRSSQV